MRKAALKISVDGAPFRVATDYVTLMESVGGQTVRVYYPPYLKAISAPKAAISVTGEPSVPNFSVTVWDPVGDLRAAMDQKEFESASCEVTIVDEDDTVLETYRGYASGVSFSEANIEFSIQLQEDASSNRQLEIFRHDSFQYFHLLRPREVRVTPAVEVHEATPWAIETMVIRGGTLFEAALPGDAQLLIAIDPEDPWLKSVGAGGAGSGALNVWVPTAPVTSTGFKRETEGITHFTAPGTITTDGTVANCSAGDKLLVVGSQYNDTVWEVSGTAVGPVTYTLDTTLTGPVSQEEATQIRLYNGFIEPRFPAAGRVILGTKGSLTTDGTGSYVTGKVEVVDYTSASYYGTINGLHIVQLTGIPLAGDFRIKHRHTAGVAVQPDNKKDLIIVSSHGYEPNTTSESVGRVCLIHTENDTFPNLANGQEFRVVNRALILTNTLQNSAVTGSILQLEVHNNHLNSAHIYGVKSLFNCGYPLRRSNVAPWTHSRNIELSTPPAPYTTVKYADFYWTVANMVVTHDNVVVEDEGTMNPQVIASSELEGLRDRLRGTRLDALNSFDEFIRVLRENVDGGNGTTGVAEPTESSEVNLNLINNASRFAVIEASSVDYSNFDYVEYISFYTPDWGVLAETAGYVVGASVEDLGHTYVDGWSRTGTGTPGEYANTSAGDSPYTNLFRYNVDHRTVGEQSGDTLLGQTDAEEFFLRQTYRLTGDPVPQNSDDLGRRFPVVYGFVERVPMLQVVSKKSLIGDVATSGDDIYIYASHPCLVRDPADIDIELLDMPEEDSSTAIDRIQGLPAGKNRFAIESPFPKVVYNHSEREQIPLAGERVVAGRRLYNPYHNLITKPTLNGVDMYGIKLRGGEWDQSLGESDKRWPIRNGLGTSTLVATFGGKVDQYGSLIQHPLDVIEDFLVEYGRYPFTADRLDQANLEDVKSQTRHLKVSCFIQEEIDIGRFMTDLCQQTGIFPYLDRGQVRFAVMPGPSTKVHHDRHLSENLNILGPVSGQDNRDNSVYNRIVYSYRMNHATNSFDAVIDLHPGNNRYCAKANKALGSKSAFEINANFVSSAAIAQEVAFKLAYLLSRHRVEFSCDATYSVEYSPGMLVPMTYAPLGLSATPVLVLEVTREQTHQVLRVARFT